MRVMAEGEEREISSATRRRTASMKRTVGEAVSVNNLLGLVDDVGHVDLEESESQSSARV